MAAKEKWEPCPRCGSNRVRTDEIGTILTTIGVMLLIVGIVFILIPFISLPLLLSSLIFTGYGVIKKRKNKNLLRCADCHNSWIYQFEQNKPI